MQITWKDRTKVGEKPAPSTKQAKGNKIPPGECGWPGCKRPRRHGEWSEGGSYMCVKHADVLLPVRALFDKLSPDALRMRRQIHAEAELAKLKAEMAEEEEAA
jgi:hypothetical protein